MLNSKLNTLNKFLLSYNLNGQIFFQKDPNTVNSRYCGHLQVRRFGVRNSGVREKKILENVFTVGELHVLTWIQIDCSINPGAAFACEEH